MSNWNDIDDFDNDLYEYSGLDPPNGNYKPVPPKSITEYRARTTGRKPGIFDREPENVSVFISGRGKYVTGRVLTPGKPFQSIPQDDMILQKQIREVSGLGYRNEMIENNLKSNEPDEFIQNEPINYPDLKLKETKQKSPEIKQKSPEIKQKSLEMKQKSPEIKSIPPTINNDTEVKTKKTKNKKKFVPLSQFENKNTNLNDLFFK